ncbi:MAG: response regulator transcription factor [Cellulomonas sp.]|nr:response regulator transcription factor [Cellulomonas sp.]
MTRVLIADDQPLIRQAVTDILAGEGDIVVQAHAVNGADALARARELRPDVVVMDIRMPEMDGIEATARICADPELTGTRVLMLTTFEEDEYLLAALRAGASGFIGKGAEPEEIVRAVRAVHAGDALLSPAATRSLIARYVEVPDPRAVDTSGVLGELTDREQQVLLLVAKGRSNQDIAEELVISPHTAKTHVNRVMTKLQAHDRAQLVIVAYESGLLTPGS